MEEGMATHSSILAWRIPWTEETVGLQSMGSQRFGQYWSNLACSHAITTEYLSILLFPICGMRKLTESQIYPTVKQILKFYSIKAQNYVFSSSVDHHLKVPSTWMTEGWIFHNQGQIKAVFSPNSHISNNIVYKIFLPAITLLQVCSHYLLWDCELIRSILFWQII